MTKDKKIDKFREAAKQLQTDDSEERLDRTIKKIAKATPPETKPGKNKPAK